MSDISADQAGQADHLNESSASAGSDAGDGFAYPQDIVSDTFLETIVVRVLDARASVSKEARNQLNRQIKQSIRKQGFRDASAKPAAMLKSDLLAMIPRSRDLLSSVLIVWTETEKELRTDIEHYLAALSADHRSSENTSLTDWLTEHVSQFVALRPAHEREAVRLMLFHLHATMLTDNMPLFGKASVTEHSEESAYAPATFSPALLEIVQQLHALPVDAPEWDDIPAFIEVVQELAQKKLDQRASSRQPLRDALIALSHAPAHLLPFFHLEPSTCWSADAADLDHLIELTDQVHELKGHLQSYEDIDLAPRASTIDELRTRRDQMDIHESEISRLFAILDSHLRPADPPVPPEPDEEIDASDDQSEIDTTGDSPEVGAEARPNGRVAKDTPLEAGAASANRGACAEVSGDSAVPEPELVNIRTNNETEPDVAPSHKDESLPAHLDLCTGIPRELALAITQVGGDTPAAWYALALSLIAHQDLPGAWWLLRWLESTGEIDRLPVSVRIPAWMVAANWGASWISFDGERFATDLFSIVQEHEIDQDSDAQILLGIAAALTPTLIAPYNTGMGAWLESPWRLGNRPFPAVAALCDVVREFSQTGIVLRSELLHGAIGREEREAHIAAASQATREWLLGNRDRRSIYAPASDVWRTLTYGGEIEQLLRPVIYDERTAVDELAATVALFRTPRRVNALIDETHRRQPNRRGGVHVIEGASRRDLLLHINEACDCADEWCTRVQNERQFALHDAEWLSSQVQRLRSDVQSTLPNALAELHDIRVSSASAPIVAAVAVLELAFTRLRGIVGLDSLPEPALPWSALVRSSADLDESLYHRLVWLPETSGMTTPYSNTDLHHIANALRDTLMGSRSLRQSFDEWLTCQDYRHGETLLSALADAPDITQLTRGIEAHLEGSTEALRARHDELANLIGQAAIDGALPEEARVRLTAELATIPIRDVLEFYPVFARLDAMETEIMDARSERLTHLQQLWPELRDDLGAQSVDEDLVARFSERVERALALANIRVVDEYLAQARRAINGAPLEDVLPDRVGIPHDLEDFLRSRNGINEALGVNRSWKSIRDAVREGKRVSVDLDFRNISPLRRTEATHAMGAWYDLKSNPRVSDADLVQAIERLLLFLGFTITGGTLPQRPESRGTDWIHLRLRMSASDLARPIPQFGSQAHELYDVVLLWNRPGAEMIGARLGEMKLTSHPVIAIYLGRLTRNQRPSIASMARERGLELAVLDELLLLYLAQQRDARLPVFLRCALPYALVNPYTPVGDVSPEMFFGRQSLVQDLQQPSGTNLVYGGRQLGKPALLKRVQREFHRPERGQFAWIIDLKGQLDPTHGTEGIWRVLRDRFREVKLIAAQMTSDRPEVIISSIRSALEQTSDRRVIVMFDEADEFLDMESRTNFRQVTQFRQLMIDTDRRFRVIFAGLHDVQRFQSIPNQPLAQFGAAARLGPLESDAARDLVVQPLETLGYRFQDDDAVLRILSYTNYHPGLIQLFCQKLLNARATSTSQHQPPFNITQEHVDAVYRDPDVQRGIRERFAWTLALDRRYQAVTWSMIVDQIKLRDSYARSFTPARILELARGWWPHGFEGLSAQEFRVLLDEMDGLNVLIRDSEGRYLLRSPNVVRLMGSESDIESDLLELENLPVPGPVDADSYHAMLHVNHSRYSPLTALESRALVSPQSGVALVLASDALGLRDVMPALTQLAPEESVANLEKWAIEATSQPGGTDFEEWLDGRSQQVSQALVLCPVAAADGNWLVDVVRHAMALTARRQRSRERWVRAIFILDAASTWAWLTTPDVDREALELDGLITVSPRTWNGSGIRQRLEQRGSIALEDRCSLALEATGGWPALLDSLFANCSQDIDVACVTDFAARLADPGSDTNRSFRAQLGADVADPVWRLLGELVALDAIHIPLSLVSDIVEDMPDLTTTDCQKSLQLLECLRCIEITDGSVVIDRVVQQVLRAP